MSSGRTPGTRPRGVGGGGDPAVGLAAALGVLSGTAAPGAIVAMAAVGAAARLIWPNPGETR